MTPVERARHICKERGISISKMEKDLSFGNGYLNPKKITEISSDRAALIADYLGISVEFLISGEEKEKPATNGDGRDLVNGDEELTELLERARDDPHIRMLFRLTKSATPEDVEKAIKIIQMLRGE